MDNSFIRRWRGPWGQRKTVEAMVIGVALLTAFSVFTASTQRIRKSSLDESSTVASCRFPAIFNFGDSNSDTGSVSAVFGRCPPPNGRTFFGKPSGRYSDGRLIVDFLGNRMIWCAILVLSFIIFIKILLMESLIWYEPIDHKDVSFF